MKSDTFSGKHRWHQAVLLAFCNKWLMVQGKTSPWAPWIRKEEREVPREDPGSSLVNQPQSHLI